MANNAYGLESAHDKDTCLEVVVETTATHI